MPTSDIKKPRGILKKHAGSGAFRHVQYPPPEDLRDLVEHFWSVRWDLRGREPYLQEVLPHPSIHIVVETGSSGPSARVLGVVRRKFTKLLEERGSAFGIKFRPGAFAPFLDGPVSLLTDRSVELDEIFGADGAALAEAIMAAEEDEERMARGVDFFRARLPEPDPRVALAGRLVELIVSDREILKVDHVVERHGVNKRVLQRLFDRYVGVSPKWVIQRSRLHEVAERLAAERIDEWAGLAVELGYFDQAHFIRDFRRVVGISPAEYMRRERAASTAISTMAAPSTNTSHR